MTEEFEHIDGNPRNNVVSNIRRVQTVDVLLGPKSGEFVFLTADAWRYAARYMVEAEGYDSITLPWHVTGAPARIEGVLLGVQMTGLKLEYAE